MSPKATLIEKLLGFFSVNLGTKIISIIVAVVLWAFVLGSRNVEVTKEVPIEVITHPDVVPANELPDRIAFRLSGPKAFLRSVVDRREEPIRVNLSNSKPALMTYRFFSDNIRVPIGVKVLSINPTSILIKLESLKKKEVPVHAELRGVPAEGFQVVHTEIKPSTVRIKGAESRVDGISEVSTLPIDVSHMTKSFEREVPIDLARYNIQMDSEFPKVFVEIEPVSANFRIKNIDIHVLSSYKSRVEEKSVTVLVRASPEDIQALDRNQVFGLVDLTGKGRGRYTEPVKVTLPKNMSLVRTVPDQVTVTLY